MQLDKLTVKSQEALAQAQRQATEAEHPQVGPLHLLAAIIEGNGTGDANGGTGGLGGTVARCPSACCIS